MTIDHFFYTTEVASGKFFAGELFQRSFAAPPPDEPSHYVAFYREHPLIFRTLGYIHFRAYRGVYLGGGLCIDPHAYRRLPPEHRRLLRTTGGIAEQLLRFGIDALHEVPAHFVYVVDSRSERIVRRVGFVPTEHQYLLVRWNQAIAAGEQQRLIRMVAELGPF
jgi:hypothetical protein